MAKEGMPIKWLGAIICRVIVDGKWFRFLWLRYAYMPKQRCTKFLYGAMTEDRLIGKPRFITWLMYTFLETFELKLIVVSGKPTQS